MTNCIVDRGSFQTFSTVNPRETSTVVQRRRSFFIDDILRGIDQPVTMKIDFSRYLSESNTDDDDDDDIELYPQMNRRKKKKARTTFTVKQILELEKKFAEKKYLSPGERTEMANGLMVTETQVKIWSVDMIFNK